MNLKNGKLLINGSEVDHSATNVRLSDVWATTVDNMKEGEHYRIQARDFHKLQIFNGNTLDMRWIPDQSIIWL